MCFPGKRQKNNFAEPKPERKDTKADKVEPMPSLPPVLSPAPAPLLEPIASEPLANNLNMSAPRVAIVIYSLYGHIAKRMSLRSLPLTHLNKQTFPRSRRGCQEWCQQCWR